MKSELLMDFIGEEVSVVTDTMMAMMTPEGEITELPYIAEGVLLDQDDEYIALGMTSSGAPELLSKAHVVSVKLTDKLEKFTRERPPEGEWN